MTNKQKEKSFDKAQDKWEDRLFEMVCAYNRSLKPIGMKVRQEAIKEFVKEIEKNIVGWLPAFPNKRMKLSISFWLPLVKKAINQTLKERRGDEKES